MSEYYGIGSYPPGVTDKDPYFTDESEDYDDDGGSNIGPLKQELPVGPEHVVECKCQECVCPY